MVLFDILNSNGACAIVQGLLLLAAVFILFQ